MVLKLSESKTLEGLGTGKKCLHLFERLSLRLEQALIQNRKRFRGGLAHRHTQLCRQFIVASGIFHRIFSSFFQVSSPNLAGM